MERITVKFPINLESGTLKNILSIIRTVMPEIAVETITVPLKHIQIVYEDDDNLHYIVLNRKKVDYGLIARTLGMIKYFSNKERRKEAIREGITIRVKS